MTPAVRQLLLGARSGMNLLTFSEQFDNAAWSKVRSTVTANALTAPDGSLTADKLVEDATAASTHYLFQTVSKDAVQAAYTLSVYAKAAERTFLTVLMQNGTGAVGSRIFFDLANGAIGSTQLVGTGFFGAAGRILPAPGGYFRCSMSLVTDTDTSVRCGFELASANGTVAYAGDAASGVFIHGAQLETGPAATRYRRVPV